VGKKRRAGRTQKIRGTVLGRGAPRRKPPAASAFRIRVLDPRQKCGADTSVLQLFRIDETIGGEVRSHLVYFDRHGWYCEHGRDCAAVAPARALGANAR
jgi:hypothetical protein